MTCGWHGVWRGWWQWLAAGGERGRPAEAREREEESVMDQNKRKAEAHKWASRPYIRG